MNAEKSSEKIENSNPNDNCLSSKLATIINVESYPEFDYTERNNPIIDTIISPRIKNNKKNIAQVFQVEENMPEEIIERRNKLNNFLAKMENFQKAKEEKIVNLQALKKQQEEKEFLQIPKVKMSSQSKKIVENKKNGRNLDRERVDSVKSYLLSPSPKAGKPPQVKRMTSSSNKNLSTKNLLENSNKKFEDLDRQPPKTTPSSLKSEKVLASKFIKEFNKRFDVVSEGGFSLDINKVKSLMKDLFFLSQGDEKTQKTQENLIKKFWKITEADQMGEISMENLKTFCLGIMNYFLPSMNNGDDTILLGRVVNGKYYLNQKEVLKIHKIFLLFYENRMFMIKKINYQKKIENSTKANDIFKNLKSNETKIIYQCADSDKSIDTSYYKEKNRRVNKSFKGRTRSIGQSERFQTPNKARPRTKSKLDESFRSSRSRSILAKRDSTRSISENEFKALATDKISDPSVLTMAKDILGQFISTKTEKKCPEKLLTQKSENSLTSKLIFKKKTELNSLSTKKIDDKLKLASNLLKDRLKPNLKELVLEVSMPNGSQKTLIIPQNACRKTAVSRFVKENHLSPKMERTLIDSIEI